ncbi:MAG: sodium:glutamate symporter [Synergistaceae bacterium]|jgi:ESS family glutamate:Na+ symporter|nr:sodium:glutamate symporter [Synergistaceae bacterium]
MTWDTAEGLVRLNFDPLFTVAIASMLFIMGAWLRRKIALLRRFCVPSGVVGGLCMAFFALTLYHSERATISFDHVFQIPMVSIFFTRVGMTGSFRLLTRGGRTLFKYLLFCWGLVLFQNALGVLLAKLFGIHPVLGVMAGAVSLEGGHNLAVIFGPMAESLGVSGAGVVAVASATFGLMAGGTLGAPVAEWLIRSRRLEIATSYDMLYKGYHDLCRDGHSSENENIEIHDFVHTLGLLLVIMALGRWGAERLQARIAGIPGWESFTLPGYVGAMFLAVIFRNVNDAFKIVRVHPKSMDLISTVSVSLFLTVSMMSLRIWELYGLALPLVIILAAQTVAVVGIAVVFLFPMLGGDYDAAVICSGFVGHGLGAPPSAVSMMRAVCDQYNVISYRAFLIVPLCGAVLIDILALPVIIWFVGYFAR